MIYEKFGAKFYTKDDIVYQHWKKDGRFEPETTNFFFDVLSNTEGGFIDVGTNTGYFSIIASLMGKEVTAFEPFPSAYNRLLENLELNETQIKVCHAAASDFIGETQFHYDAKIKIPAGSSIETGFKRNRQSMTVPVVTVDSQVSHPVSLLKIDVEGHELAVLRGSKDTIEKNRPFLILEANKEHHLEDLQAWCEENGYVGSRADVRNFLCKPRQ